MLPALLPPVPIPPVPVPPVAEPPAETMPARRPRKRILWPALAALLLTATAVALAPRAQDFVARLLIQDDPAAIARRAVDARLTPAVAESEIADALKADDVDLANSFMALAADRGMTVSPALADQVKAANSGAASTVRNLKSFTRGLVIGEPSDMVGLAGTALGDLFVFGDIRDATREGIHYVKGEAVDEPLLGLACVGIAITAGTYASLGLAAPTRVGLSLVKAARKTGRLGAPLAAWIGRSLRGVVDMGGLRRAFAEASITRPALAVRAAREAVKLDKAEGLMDAMRDVGRVQQKAGTQAALESLKVAEGPRDMSRLARLAAAAGGKTRAIIKLVGRAAIVLAFAAFEIGGWALGTIMMLLGFLASIRSITERATLRYCDRRRMRRLRRQVAALTTAQAAAPALAPA
jgi:hypothetical protein